MIEHEIRKMPLAELNPAPYNPRTISESAYDGLSHSIDRFGLLSLIVWNEYTGNIVGGHQRYHKLMENGETETKVIVVNLDENDEVALNITLNSHEIRGDFTEDVVSMLAKSEVQLGSAFSQIGLSDLSDFVNSLKFNSNDDTSSKKDSKEPKEKKDNKEPVEDSNEPQAILECPSCHALWRLEDNQVIYNGEN